MTEANSRKADHPIDPVFLERWSPRAFDGQSMSEADLFTILEAARWAPSAYNSQPWRFIYARHGTPAWERLLGVLNPFNQSWAKNAAALIVVLSNPVLRPPGGGKDVPSHSHSFDAGAAWGALGLQAAKLGYQAHGMVGIAFDKAFADLDVPPGWRVEAAIAIGRPGDKSQLPESLQAREQPSPRRPLSETVFEGRFGGS